MSYPELVIDILLYIIYVFGLIFTIYVFGLIFTYLHQRTKKFSDLYMILYYTGEEKRANIPARRAVVWFLYWPLHKAGRI
jgi:hypothetical protein